MPELRTADHPRRFTRITFFYSNDAEFQAMEPVAKLARERRYEVSFSQDPQEPAEIGVFCSHSPDPGNARFSAVMLHDLGQEQWPESPSREPNFWSVSPWNYFDIAVLPGRAWSECWRSVSWHASARPRIGVFELGWPKADCIFRDRAAFAKDVEQLRRALGLRERPSVLYAPSFENDGKQDDFVRSLLDMPVNLLIKQDNWPEEITRIRETTVTHQALGDNIYVIDPEVNIMYCLALADAVVSDESNCLAEALLFDLPGVSVTDWPIPAVGGWPARFSEPPPFSLTALRGRLRGAVEDVLHNQAELRLRMRLHRDHYFSCLGQSSTMIMDVLDSAMTGAPWPVAPLTPQAAKSPGNILWGSSGQEGGEGPLEAGEEAPAPVIDDYGPRRIEAGVPFNVQPSGASALWFHARHATYRTVVVFDGRELRSAVAQDGRTVSAAVPDELFRVSGEHAVFLFDKLRRQKSEVVKLRVE
jgi:hypothetical protein